MNTKVMFSSASDEWSTPRDVYDKLNKEFHFDSDPCPIDTNTDYGFKSEIWKNRVFINPPYSKINVWVKLAYYYSQKGKLIVMLIPSRTDTDWWHKFVMKAKEIRFIKGRLKFGGHKNPAPFPSAIVIFKS